MTATLRPAFQPQREVGLEFERGAAGRLEAVGERDRDVIGGAEDIEEAAEEGRLGLLLGAAGRVEGEVRALGVDAEVPDLDRDPFEQVGDRV